MRVLYFSRTLTGHDRRFLAKLAESEHEIWFLALEEHSPLPSDLAAKVRTAPSLGAAGFGIRQLPGLAPRLQASLSKIRPDLVHAGPVPSCGYLAALAGFHPLLLQSWGSDILVDADRDAAHQEATRSALAHADALFCDCDAVRVKAQSLGGPTGDRVVQFPWGVDLQRFRPGAAPQSRQRLGWQDAFVVLSTRSWEPLYGIDVLVEAFRLAARREPRLRLLLAGSGSLAPAVEAQIAAGGLEGFTHRPGNIDHDQLPDYFRAADLFMSCSYSDGSSVSMLEAMATALPVLLTDAPGNREWVAAGENGWLGAPGNAESFATGLLRAVKASSREREAMGAANRRAVESRADWHRNFPKLLEAYSRLGSARTERTGGA
ncbi:MAG TPA: glycosyltransferase [Terriglobales bacterium]|nr:glycosyltransferase [Terriglobales bacterium]